MVMQIEEWKTVLSAVDADKGLTKDNVIEKIQNKLKRHSKEYEEWEKAGFDINHSFDYYALLDFTTTYGYFGLANTLIKRGADVNAVNKWRDTPLHRAAVSGNIELAGTLISHGANVNAADEFGDIPLHRAAAAVFGNIGLAETLIAHGANVNAANELGDTPLHKAIVYCDANLTKTFIAHGADVNAVGKLEKTPLHLAAENGYKEVVDALLEKDVIKINEQDKDGKTPLHRAAMYGYKDLANTLIAHGANVNAVDELEKTPLDYAESQDVVEALLKAGGRSFVKASNKGFIAGSSTTLLGTATAVALFTTGTITAELIPIVIVMVAVTAAALTVGGVTYKLLKPNTKVDGVAVLTNVREESASITL